MKRTPRSFRTLGIEQLESRLALDGSPLVKGDFNRDGHLTVADISAMMAAFADLKNYQVTQGLTDAQLLQIGDADGSGMISNADFQAVMNLVASAAAAAPPPGTWFDSNVQDAGIRAIGDQEFADGVMDRNDMINLFREVESNGAVTSTEMSDLTKIVNTPSLFGSLDYVDQLASNIVLGNAANAHYQGAALGNLAVGSSAAQLELLVDKWFLGTDHPVASSAYQPATQPLFLNGAAYTDIRQGGVPDCYIMASLAEVALKSPGTIYSMFIDNGDGTYTFRYYTDDQPYLEKGVAHYVTVDSQLPSGYADHSSELWVALAEKAYAQFTGNSYANLDFGSINASLSQITGNTWLFPMSDLSSFVDAYNAGAIIGLTSAITPASPSIVGLHAYALVSYDATTQILTLYNPWGSLVTISWADVSSNFAAIQGVNAS